VARSAADWGALQRAIAGEVVLPESPSYDAARKPPIVNFEDVRPQAVALCETVADVAEVISFAARLELPTAARSGGHCFAGRSSTEGIVIDVTPMSSISVSGDIATIGAGARLEDIYAALGERGLTIPAGCGPTVGIAGLTLGGGFGILGRRYGLTSDQLLEAQVVLGDGRVVDCDERRHEDLFWALRGAGASRLGVVTSLTFRTVPAPDATSFHLTWPHTDAVAVIGAWQTWSPAGPDELAASLLVTAHGDEDQPPLVNLFGAMVGSAADAEGLLEEAVARAGVDPASESLTELPYAQTKRHLDDHSPGDDRPGHMFAKSEFFRRQLPPEAIAALVEDLATGRTASESRDLDFSPWGGAYIRTPPDATAFVHRDALFLLKHGAVVDAAAPASTREAARGWLASSWETAHPWGTGGVYPNFPDPTLNGSARAYHGANLDRLRRVKASYDSLPGDR
jgi:FAD/FMN-containing dehydrogenase